MRTVVLTCLMAFVVVGIAGADVKLPAVIGSDMVLQRDMLIPIWGWAEPGEWITVKMLNQVACTAANREGKWRVKIGPFKAGGPYDVTVAGKNSIALSGVMVGEVWVCSGQSNMGWSVNGALNPEQEIAAANYPNIRLFQVKTQTSDKPLADTQGQWNACTPGTIPGFTAVGYFFGRDLHRTLNVPVGLIQTAWGGTAAEAWTSRPVLEAAEDHKPILERWDKWVADYPAGLDAYNKAMEQWTKDAEQAKKDGTAEPKKPNPPYGSPGDPNRPANLYNGMIAPIIPYAIKGAIWYQGESNAGRAYQYRTLFADMIQDWRHRWGEGDFPFLWVQLANFMGRNPAPAESAWAELREAQDMTRELPNAGQAVIIDVGDAADIHPRNKQDVGKRLCLAAQKIAYGQDVPWSGPIAESVVGDQGGLRVKFSCAFGGLVAKGGEPLKGFAIAGEDKKFVWASAKIEGDTVLVSSPEVPAPVAVRYAWADNPECNLYSGADLPASPFRTDSWAGVTVNSK